MGGHPTRTRPTDSANPDGSKTIGLARGGAMVDKITPQEANSRLLGPGEVALIDLREPGPFSEGHPLFAVPCPFSALEADIAALVPRLSCPMMLLDDGTGVATEAAARLSTMG